MSPVMRRDTHTGLLLAAAAAIAVILAVGGLVANGRNTDTHRRASSTDSAAVTHASAIRGAQHVPVLCYHYLRGKSSPIRLLRVFGYVVLSLPLLENSELWTTSSGEFERQMEYLAANDYHTVTLDELNEWQAGLRDLPPRSVVLTFDDADRSVYDYAYPVLKRLRFCATVFVVTGRVGTRWSEVDVMDWPHLRELAQSGVFDIQSHTHNLHYKVNDGNDAQPVFLAATDLAGAPAGGTSWEELVRDDLTTSRDAIRTNIGRTPAYLAWPYGFGNPRVDRVALDVGFTRTCSLRRGANLRLRSTPATSDTDAFEIARYTITARTSLRNFRSMVQGIYEPGT